MIKWTDAYQYEQRLFAFIDFHIKDKQTTGEILQDTFVKIWRSFEKGRYIEEGNLYAWTKQVAYSVMIDHLRKQKQTSFSSIEPFNEPSTEMVIFAGERDVQKNANYKILMEMVNELPDDFRDTIALHYYLN